MPFQLNPLRHCDRGDAGRCAFWLKTLSKKKLERH
jgi:hypothetical protein